MDYAGGIFLIASPWIFGFADGSPAQWIPVIIGLMILGMSLFTRYELGLIGIIPVYTHLVIDIFTGLFLASSPWLFDFMNTVYWPHLIFGLFQTAAGYFTYQIPADGTRAR